MARRAEWDSPGVTAEMIWILTSCDPEDEDALYDVLEDRTKELHTGVWSERKLNQAAAKVLAETRVQFSCECQRRSMEG